MTIKKIQLIRILFLTIFLGTGLISSSSLLAQASCPANTTPDSTQAILVGEITNHGGDPNLDVWFRYGLTTSYGLESQHSSQYGTGAFCTTVYNLTPCTLYDYIAVGKNSAGTSYGENKTFTTKCLSVAVDLKVNSSDGPITLNYNSNANLSWNSSNAVFCQATGDWSGSKGVSGSQSVQLNQVRTYTFTLTCQDSTGTRTATDSVTVNVTPNPPVVVTKPAIVTY